MAGVKRRIGTESDIHALHKELDEASCPICMDHPHNAVLLICSSHDKGCRSYICDTSYRHSNCLDRFKKLRPESRNSALQQSFIRNPNSSSNASDVISSLQANLGEVNQNQIQNGGFPITRTELVERREQSSSHGENLFESVTNLKCPLCRGAVLGWKVDEEARRYLNVKKRSCSRETCSFTGDYQELRRHARRVHPTTRPSDVDPSRERAWRRIEHQSEYGDIVSAIRSAMPGAVVVGDYVIENGDGGFGERDNGNGGAPWWTTFFLFQMIGSLDHGGGSRARSRAWSRHRRSSERRYIWGENLLGLRDDDDDTRMSTEANDDLSPVPRRRRRLNRSRSDEDHP